MPKASVKRLIECKKEDLINLVLDIEKYPEFIPFCYAAKIYETSEKNNQIKIIDLNIEGISLVIAQREEFQSFLANNDYDLDKLIEKIVSVSD